MKPELGTDANIPDLWRMAALLEICPDDAKEHVMVRPDETGENCDNVKSTVVSYSINKTEQTRGRHNEMFLPMGVDRVRGSEPKRKIGKMWTRRRQGRRHRNMGKDESKDEICSGKFGGSKGGHSGEQNCW